MALIEPGFNIYYSNRLERLAEQLASVLRSAPPADALEPEIVVTLSKGMERWLALTVARMLGVWANIRVPFPAAVTRDIFKAAATGIADASAFEPEILLWRIMKMLPSCAAHKDFGPIRSYLENDFKNIKRYQLSAQIADTLDHYLLYRPELILEWDGGADDSWEAELWRRLTADLPEESAGSHHAAAKKRFLDAAAGGSIRTDKLPARVNIFGISSLPKYYIEIFAALARFVQVNLFLLSPSRDQWFCGALPAAECGGREALSQVLPNGNELLFSMGALGAELRATLPPAASVIVDFEEPAGSSLLSLIQRDIFTNEAGVGEKRAIPAGDASVRVSSCHSVMREIESLYDNLLDAFEREPALRPVDIIVMIPDMETYTPYIQAVFGTRKPEIPYSVAGRSLKGESLTAETFTALLGLFGSRFGATQVMAPLENPAVRDRFGLDEAEADLMRRRVAECGIRWGADGESKRRLGLPAENGNTWDGGLSRLLIGYAMSGGGERVYEPGGILPCDDVEGGEAQTLGKFTEYADKLFSFSERFDGARPLKEWAALFEELLDAFFESGEETEREILAIRTAARSLADCGEKSGFSEPVDIEVVKQQLAGKLEKKSFELGYLTGRVTFSAMVPMRGIPAKMICLIGMNDEDFPGRTRRPGFDRMAERHEPGDRSQRNDDRYLFLEALVSARDRLYISYIGRNASDNERVPPSVLVSELLDYIEKHYTNPSGVILGQVVAEHRLQAFSPEYFEGGEKLFSYDRANLLAARGSLNKLAAQPPFAAAVLKPPSETRDEVDIAEFCDFFANPARRFMRKSLGVYLDDYGTLLEDTEPFEIGGLEKFQLGERLVGRILARGDPEEILRAARRSGVLPHGAVGEKYVRDLLIDARGFAEKVRAMNAGVELPPFVVDIPLGGFRLTGRIEGARENYLLNYRFAKLKAKDRLRAWIQHLAACAAGYGAESALIAKDGELTFAKVGNGAELLLRLGEIYSEGLLKPAPFFPETSMSFYREFEKVKNQSLALKAANRNWAPSDYGPGESMDAYINFCFRGANPFGEKFATLAREIFGPCFENEGGPAK
ncbi:MAG: exodeoxyribonuclease V subunit gamma [bacterium]